VKGTTAPTLDNLNTKESRHKSRNHHHVIAGAVEGLWKRFVGHWCTIRIRKGITQRTVRTLLINPCETKRNSVSHG